METALITGASSGIGLELARICAKQGINLVITARSAPQLEELATELRKEGVQVDVLVKDLSAYTCAREIFDWCQTNNRAVHYLINNAGFGDYGIFHESDWDKQERMINLNITALAYLTHLFLPGMIQRGKGRIMNVASTASFQPGPTMSVYYASKAFVLHFSEALANELKPFGITVTALCPGATESGFQAVAGIEETRLVKGRKLPGSREVAEYGFRAMMRGKRVAIHGTLNRMMVFGVRFMPRKWVVGVARFVQDKRKH
jgi:short-subunit dehydrogenase